MPTNAKKNVYKEKEFQTYVLWKSLPAFFRGMQKKELQFYGFTDPIILKIVMIKNQTSFAKKFNIKDLGTLTDWNKRIRDNNLDSFALNAIFKKEFEKINLKNIPQLNKALNVSTPKQPSNKKIVLKKKLLSKKATPDLDKEILVSVPDKQFEDITVPSLKTKTLSQKIKEALFKWRIG